MKSRSKYESATYIISLPPKGSKEITQNTDIQAFTKHTLVPWVLDKGRVSGQLGRREREDAAVGRKGRTGV